MLQTHYSLHSHHRETGLVTLLALFHHRNFRKTWSQLLLWLYFAVAFGNGGFLKRISLKKSPVFLSTDCFSSIKCYLKQRFWGLFGRKRAVRLEYSGQKTKKGSKQTKSHHQRGRKGRYSFIQENSPIKL